MNKSGGLQVYHLDGQSPIHNVKCTIVPCTGTDYVFLYGGFDEMDNLDSNVYLLNLVTKRWEVDDKHVQLYREGHLAVYIGNGNILVIGGVPYDEFPEALTSDDSYQTSNGAKIRKDSFMLIYNIFDRNWSEPSQTSKIGAPSGRSRHACCLSPDGTKVYIFGGLVNSCPLNDLYCYDLKSASWFQPIEFVARFDHFIAIHDTKLFSFGGLDKDMNHVKDKVVFYNFEDGSIGEVSISRRSENLSSQSSSPKDREASENTFDISPTDYELTYLNSEPNSSIKLEVRLPLWMTRSKDIEISSYDVDRFQTTNLFSLRDLNFYFKKNYNLEISNYIWKESFVTESRSLFLLGHSLKDQSNTSDWDETSDGGRSHEMDDDSGNTHLSSLFELNLAEIGVPMKGSASVPEFCDVSSSFVNDFKHMLLRGDYSDFEIATFVDEQLKEEWDGRASGISYNDETTVRKIKVHKSILLSRWPHFRRAIESGMNETLSSVMMIPEPFLWVMGLVYYLYTGSIYFEEFAGQEVSVVDYSGLLILSNLYDLPDLRQRVLVQLLKFLNNHVTTAQDEMSTATLLQLWKRLVVSNESILIAKVLGLIKLRWSEVIRSKIFMELSKDLIIKLCQDCSDDFNTPKFGFPNTPTSSTSSIEGSNFMSFSPSKRTHSISPILNGLRDPINLESEILEGFPTLQYFPSDNKMD
ncbi:uncharacterized protein PRCAT00004177001 [Priceomyces carsonii]|uniref:uncharacterized protein n=1 Tax=Priceomyces carsonii TaxID=28549 RepID=UPI002ED826A0|nr:unnamed protein product [Priceomyces carsonii]